MTIELNARPSQPGKLKPYLIRDTTQDELNARKLLLAPDVDYMNTTDNRSQATGPITDREDFEIPQLEEREDTEKLPKKFESKLLPIDLIPKLVGATAVQTVNRPRHRL